jgi:hypothetical protein
MKLGISDIDTEVSYLIFPTETRLILLAVKRSRSEPCFPYTWHKRWQKDHNALEIGFKGTAPEAHSISFKGAPAISAMPKYIFAERKDFEDFQSELRGKHLEATFDVSQITCASSSKNGEATDQHLKIWRDFSSQEFSISFYASAIPKPRHMEFPLAMFDQQTSSKKEFEICINFVGHGEPKRARTFSKAFSRSPTERSTSSASTTGKKKIASQIIFHVLTPYSPRSFYAEQYRHCIKRLIRNHCEFENVCR